MKVVVGTNTIVKKITVGTPIRIGSAANGSLTGLDDVNGSVNLANGTILQYDSNSGKFIHVSAADITGSGLNVNDAGGLGSLVYDSANSIIQYTGPSADSVQSLFNATYDSSALGSLSYSNGTIDLTGPTAAQIRALFSAGNDLQYNQATGEFSVTIPPGGGAIGDGGQSLSVVTSGDYGSLSYEAANAVLTHVGTNDSDIRGSISVGGDLSYDQSTGTISYNKRTDTDIRSLFSAGGDLTYNSTTGQFAITTGAHYQDSDARHSIDFLHNADSINNVTEYGSVNYDKSTGLVTIFGTKDSDIRGSISLQDSGGLGSLTYIEKEGKFIYRGAGVDSLFSYFSVDEGPTSLGDLFLDSATGSIRFQLDEDSIRRLISVVSDNEGGTHLSYDHSTGVITFRGPSTLEVRDLISVDSIANVGDGSLRYHESSGVFTYIGPQAFETRKHFNAGLGLDYDSGTGTYRIDSTSNSIMNTLRADTHVSTPLLINDSDVIINPQSANGFESAGNVDVKGSMRVYGAFTSSGNLRVDGNRATFNVNNFYSDAKRPHFARNIQVDSADIDGAGIVFGTADSANGEPINFKYDLSTEQMILNRGLTVGGTLIAQNIQSPTTASLQAQIDALPDSAQSRKLLSAGPGLTYNDSLGIYRITSSGVVAGIYGTINKVPQITVDSLGQIDSIKELQISTVENFQFDSTSGNLKITTATDSFNVGFTLDPYSTVNLVEDPNATPT